jgi:phosphoglycolate phosphatase
MPALDKKAVLFDLDGTLLDTIEDIADSMNAALGDLGFPGHDIAAYKYFVGEGMELLARRALPENLRSEKNVKTLTAAMRHEYGTRWRMKSTPYPGISELLDGLATRGLTLAILSNKTDSFTQMIVQEYFSAWDFAVIVGSRPDVPKKPNPAGALNIAETVGAKPEEFLYLGDTATDMKTATAAGMYAVGALWGFRSAEELKKNGAAVLISNPVQMLSLL